MAPGRGRKRKSLYSARSVPSQQPLPSQPPPSQPPPFLPSPSQQPPPSQPPSSQPPPSLPLPSQPSPSLPSPSLPPHSQPPSSLPSPSLPPPSQPSPYHPPPSLSPSSQSPSVSQPSVFQAPLVLQPPSVSQSASPSQPSPVQTMSFPMSQLSSHASNSTPVQASTSMRKRGCTRSLRVDSYLGHGVVAPSTRPSHAELERERKRANEAESSFASMQTRMVKIQTELDMVKSTMLELKDMVARLISSRGQSSSEQPPSH